MASRDVATQGGAGATATKHNPRLGGIRGICATVVVLTHIASTGGVLPFGDHPGVPFWGWLLSGLEVFLPPFFVLSGYLLFRPFVISILLGTPRPAAGPFLMRRVLRLMPAYWVVWIVALLTLNLYSVDGFWYVLRPVLLLHSFDMDWWPVGLEPTWTVTTEFAFYFSLPAIAWLIGRYARRADDPWLKTRRVMIGLIPLVVVGWIWHAYVSLPSVRAGTMYGVSDLNFWPPRYLGPLAIGMALAALAAYVDVTGRTPAFWALVRRRPNLLWLGALVVYLANVTKPFGDVFALDGWSVAQYHMDHLLVQLFSGLLIAPLTVPQVRSRLADAVLTNPVSTFLGKISYSLYLWHVVILTIAIGAGNINGRTGVMDQFELVERGFQMGFWQLVLITGPAIIIAATLTYYLVEQPLVRLGHRRLGRTNSVRV